MNLVITLIIVLCSFTRDFDALLVLGDVGFMEAIFVDVCFS